jgi:hypothetical protein
MDEMILETLGFEKRAVKNLYQELIILTNLRTSRATTFKKKQQ